MKKTKVYIDAFNLYYGAFRGTPYKWLNLKTLCELLLKNNNVVGIDYFTAEVIPRKEDPDQLNKQRMYLRAIRTIPNLKIFYGHFLTSKVKMPLVKPTEQSETARVIKTEEKGSDVNLATNLLIDAFKNVYECAVVITNDSDLMYPIKYVKEEFGKTTGILNPHKNVSWALKSVVDFYKPIRSGVLEKSQFPEELEDELGKFNRPKSW